MQITHWKLPPPAFSGWMDSKSRRLSPQAVILHIVNLLDTPRDWFRVLGDAGLQRGMIRTFGVRSSRLSGHPDSKLRTAETNDGRGGTGMATVSHDSNGQATNIAYPLVQR
jgi:hypothetical protein